jgi:hypothetical protein
LPFGAFFAIFETGIRRFKPPKRAFGAKFGGVVAVQILQKV